MRYIKILLSKTLMEFKKLLAYKTEVISSIIMKALACIGHIFIYMYVFQNSLTISDFDLDQIVLYTIFMYSIYELTTTNVDLLIRELYKSGSLGSVLVRPVSLPYQLFIKEIGVKISKGTLVSRVIIKSCG